MPEATEEFELLEDITLKSGLITIFIAAADATRIIIKATTGSKMPLFIPYLPLVPTNIIPLIKF
jgi:hypothetical protein